MHFFLYFYNFDLWQFLRSALYVLFDWIKLYIICLSFLYLCYNYIPYNMILKFIKQSAFQHAFNYKFSSAAAAIDYYSLLGV